MIIFKQTGCCNRCIHADLDLQLVCYVSLVPVYSVKCKHDNVCHDLRLEKEAKMLKEVYFDVWCKKCQHLALDENEEPCWECLTNPVNEDSHKPVKYEEATNDSNSSRKDG